VVVKVSNMPLVVRVSAQLVQNTDASHASLGDRQVIRKFDSVFFGTLLSGLVVSPSTPHHD
jgi:predicted component of type VI protein secretion system